MIEKFFTDYEHTISAVSAVATVLAVIVSLWVTATSSNAHRTRIKATGAIQVIVVQEIPSDQWPKFLMVNVTNVGLMRAKVHSYCLVWSYPFAKHHLVIRPYDSYITDFVVPFQEYPIAIEPNESHNVVMTKLEDFEAMFDDQYIGSGLRRLFSRFLKLQISTVDGRSFEVKLGSGVRTIIKERTRVFGRKRP